MLFTYAFVFQLEKYVPTSKLKYYFAVDTGYVAKKLIMLLFPFTKKVCCFFITCIIKHDMKHIKTLIKMEHNEPK